MSRTAKIAGAAALGGMMMAIAIVSATQSAKPVASPSIETRDAASASFPADLRRCRTLTMPDAGCEAAWEAKRRHFFGKDER